MEIKEVSIFVEPVGWMLDIPARIVGGETGSAERSVSEALCCKVWRNSAPSHVQLGGVHGHGCAWVEVGVDGSNECIPGFSGIPQHRCTGGKAFDLEVVDVQLNGEACELA